MIQQGTDWNRHHGVGATLLENWVEERAVGEVMLEERTDLSKLSRAGHKVIIKESVLSGLIPRKLLDHIECLSCVCIFSTIEK